MSQHGESEKHGPRLYCQPHDGSRTASFLPFKQAFMVGANAHYASKDADYIWPCQCWRLWDYARTRGS